MDQTFVKMWQDMGVTGWATVIALGLMSLVALTVFIAKAWQLRRVGRVTRGFLPAFARALEEEKVQEAMALADANRNSPAARVLGLALREAAPRLHDPSKVEKAMDAVERTIEREQIALATDLKAGLPALATIGATAPFVGLLGTVTGIMTSFAGIVRTGGGGIEAVAAGIGESLIATAIGLVVAIPSVWAHNYFMARLERLFANLSYAGRELTDWMQRRAENQVVEEERELLGVIS
jgi:biopolymer transport protein ExbB/biopolymer transport protein TolQ